MNKKVYFFIALIILLIAINTFILFKPKITQDSEDPEKAIANLYKSIKVAEENGDYNCCIEPACTMCYLEHWKFEKGTCHCDKAIREGRNEDVCPECVSGLEKGLCTLDEEECELDSEVFGGVE